MELKFVLNVIQPVKLAQQVQLIVYLVILEVISMMLNVKIHVQIQCME